MKKKVYCNECKYYIPQDYIAHKAYVQYEECRSPDNKEMIIDTYLCKTNIKYPPSLINGNNNCKWFVKK